MSLYRKKPVVIEAIHYSDHPARHHSASDREGGERLAVVSFGRVDRLHCQGGRGTARPNAVIGVFIVGLVVGLGVGANVTMWYYLFGSRTYMVIDRWWLENSERWELLPHQRASTVGPDAMTRYLIVVVIAATIMVAVGVLNNSLAAIGLGAFLVGHVVVLASMEWGRSRSQSGRTP